MYFQNKPMKLKYKCLVLDHDDTVVDSTAKIHFPAFLEALRVMRPGVTMELEEYFKVNFTPGFLEYCTGTLHMTEAELDQEVEIWKNYVKNHIPTAYPGMKEIIELQKSLGGKVCVVSHSYDFNIRRDYEANDLPAPDMIFGWECPQEQRKPSPYALEKIAQTYQIKPSEMVMVDDLKPGYDMAKAYGVPFVGAGWANDIVEIRDFMKRNSDYYFTSVEQLKKFLFEE